MKWSVLKAAREWEIDRETLSKRLVRAGFTVKQGAEFTTREISSAIHGSLQLERIRLTRAQADIRESEKLERDGFLIREEQARELLARVLAPLRTLIVGLPSYAGRCNPKEPTVAEAVLRERSTVLLEAGQLNERKPRSARSPKPRKRPSPR
jgi:phage terminase Nu1 subunit (DNA packaging protein)